MVTIGWAVDCLFIVSIIYVQSFLLSKYDCKFLSLIKLHVLEK